MLTRGANGTSESTAPALSTQQGWDLPVHSAVRKGLDLWPPPATGACLSSFYPHPCLPSRHLHPSFSSPAAFTFIMPLSALLAAPQDHQAPPSPLRPAPGPCGSQPAVSFKPCLWSPLNLQWSRVKTGLCISLTICVLGEINNFINISNFTGKVIYVSLVQ